MREGPSARVCARGPSRKLGGCSVSLASAFLQVSLRPSFSRRIDRRCPIIIPLPLSFVRPVPTNAHLSPTSSLPSLPSAPFPTDSPPPLPLSFSPSPRPPSLPGALQACSKKIQPPTNFSRETMRAGRALCAKLPVATRARYSLRAAPSAVDTGTAPEFPASSPSPPPPESHRLPSPRPELSLVRLLPTHHRPPPPHLEAKSVSRLHLVSLSPSPPTSVRLSQEGSAGLSCIVRERVCRARKSRAPEDEGPASGVWVS